MPFIPLEVHADDAPRARVLCCTADPHPAAMKALAAHAPHAEIIDVAGDPHGYWQQIRARWSGRADLIIVEQDIEIREDTIGSLEDCDQPWCCYAYPIFATKVRLRTGLGCTRISAAAQRVVTAREVAEGFALCAQCKGMGCWWHLDGRISELLKHRGFTPHVHGDVAHHHDYQAGAPEHGRPVGWIHEDAAVITPARTVISGLPPEPSPNPRIAKHAANELARLAAELAGDPDRAVPAGLMAPFPLGLITPGAAYDTDKVAQGYIPAYNEISRQLGPSARVCEVGVWRGGSLATWRDMFPQGTVAGVDIDPGARWPDRTIRIVAAQDDPALPDLLYEHEYEWDLIVDDASHQGELTQATLDLLWPLVSAGGFYVIEDWFTGFPDYAGACKSPRMLDVARGLLDRLRPGTDTESVTYRYGMAIIRKKA